MKRSRQTLGVDVDTLHQMLSEVGQATVLSLDDLLFSPSRRERSGSGDTLEDTSSDTSHRGGDPRAE